MPTSRRDFLATSAALGIGALGLGACRPAGEAAERGQPPSLRILILGGTGFIGPHLVRRAGLRGHTVTLFNRGRSNADLFPDLETLIGDRDGQLDALRGRDFDAVIDTSGYVPRHVRDSATLLAERVRHYLFVSSVSAYADFDTPGIDEDYPLATMPDPTVEAVTEDTYGPMKVLAEQAVMEAFPRGATVVRPGYVVGPGDTTDRWTYWPVRVAAAGEMLAPGEPGDPIQIIDARDLASFVIHLLERRTLGVYNAVGPSTPLSMGGMLGSMTDVLGMRPRLSWVPAEFLAAREVELPIWNSPTGRYANLHRIDNDRAVTVGLVFRNPTFTVMDTVQWWNQQPERRRREMRSGLRMPPDLTGATASLEAQMVAEARLLAEWRGTRS
ncbi:MAG: NAD-dependent epimerase/dehydratase family protein [Gemmatimonadales bacterium]